MIIRFKRYIITKVDDLWKINDILTFDFTTAIPVLVILARLCCRSISFMTFPSPTSPTNLLSPLELDFSRERCSLEPFVELFKDKSDKLSLRQNYYMLTKQN